MLRRIALLVLLAACGAGQAAPSTTAGSPLSAATPPPPEPPPAAYDVERTQIDVAPGVTGDLFAAAGPGPWPVIVTLPGGSWERADRAGTAALARDLAARGAIVLNTGYRLAYPDAFGDVACALAVARDAAAARGGDPDRLVLVGHSAGAHVAAVAALGRPEPSPGCAAGGGYDPPAAFVGLAGPYDIGRFLPVPALRRLLGGTPETAPEAWAFADPYTHLAGNPGVDVALVHGRTDLVVLPVFSIEYRDALGAAGRAAELYLVPGANHADLLAPDENGTEAAGVIFAVAG